MTDSFRALRVHLEQDEVEPRLEQITLNDLDAGDVVIQVAYSGINYKDALAVTGAGRIMRKFPKVAGIDLAGTVTESADDRFKPGDSVVVTGCGLGEDHDGGYADYARVPGDWVIPLPPGLDVRAAMALGTAGFTAALAVHRMEQNGQHPDQGPVVVTGASGGVGSLAVDMLSGLGYQVSAVTGKADAAEYLTGLGATAVLSRHELELGSRPLEKSVWGGAVDNLGGDYLAWLTRTTRPWGNIASIGLAASVGLKTTVMPFILRGVSLLGINSVHVPRELRLAVWARLADDLKPRHLDAIASRELDLAELDGIFQAYIDGAVTGRTLIRVAST